MNKAWGLIGALIIASGAQAQSAYSQSGTIKNLTVGPNMARIELSNNTGNSSAFTTCSTDRQWYYLDLTPTDQGTKGMLAVLVSAKAAGQNVFVQVSGCFGAYSKIVHVYVCENSPTCS